ncbi:heme peroxidase [Mycena sp. CBHHK59/15]|nr:heme peroxidase [Mycena sp. CBHHK59/15]
MLRFALLAYLATVDAWIWPSPQLDALESQRFDLERHGIAAFIRPCDLFIFDTANSGRSDAADWIRTAYHDMATHNIVDGTGGLDASIRFDEEQSRPENTGDGFANTVGLLLGESTRYVSIADVLALAAIIAIENCGGPDIAFRGGRVDAAEPNLPGVPQPQENLESHISSFARQGFTQAEMIGLVACGHSFGGVQHAPFPDIVPELNDPTSLQSVVHFDSTPVTFDNNVANEYISNTTKNPLVVGLNDTTNSDKRIFGSDDNATMLSFANSPQLFASTCADLFARMLDTVPTGVTLSQVITPLPVKPYDLKLLHDGDNIQFSGEVRFWNMTADGDRTVQLLRDDHVGGLNNVTLVQSGTSTSAGGRNTAAWYSISLTLEAAAGITSMRFAVDGTLEDQGGVGFAVADDIMFSNSSCFNSDGNNVGGHLDVAVRNGVNPTRVYLEEQVRDDVSRPTIVEVDITPPAQPAGPDAVYAIWSAVIPITGIFDTSAYSIGAEIDGVKVTRSDPRFVTDFSPCSTVSSRATP